MAINGVGGGSGPKAPSGVGEAGSVGSARPAGARSISAERLGQLAAQAGNFREEGFRARFAALIGQEMGLTGAAARDFAEKAVAVLSQSVKFSGGSYGSVT